MNEACVTWSGGRRVGVTDLKSRRPAILVGDHDSSRCPSIHARGNANVGAFRLSRNDFDSTALCARDATVTPACGLE